jgi:fucose permease
MGLLAAASGGWASTRLLPDPPHPPPAGRRKPLAVLRHPVIVVLGAVALASMLCEGAAADWSAVYLRESLDVRAGVAGLGYAVFSAAMVAVRLSGDYLLRRYRARTLLPVLAAVASVGMAAALPVGHPVAALVGYACLGAGVALIVPSAFSAAGRLPGVRPGTGVAAVSAIGWFGFVGGPPLIGRLASLITLPAALALPVLCAVIAVAARATTAFDVP